MYCHLKYKIHLEQNLKVCSIRVIISLIYAKREGAVRKLV